MTDDLTTARSMAATIAALSAERDALQARMAQAFEEAAKVAEGFGREHAAKFTNKRMGNPYPVTAKPLAKQAIGIAAAIRALSPAQAGVGGDYTLSDDAKKGED